MINKEEGNPQSLNKISTNESQVTQSEEPQPTTKKESSLSNASAKKSLSKVRNSPSKGLPIPVNLTEEGDSPDVQKTQKVEEIANSQLNEDSSNPILNQGNEANDIQNSQSETKKKLLDPSKCSKMKIVALTPEGLHLFHKNAKKLDEECKVNLEENHDLIKELNEKYLVCYSNFEVSVFKNCEGEIKFHSQLSIINAKHVWFSKTAKFLCLVSKPGRNYILQVYDLDLRKKVFEQDLGVKISQDQVPNLKFTNDDKQAYFQSNPSSIQIFSPFDGFSEGETLKYKPFDYFKIRQKPDGEVMIVMVTRHNESNAIKRKGKIKIVTAGCSGKPILDRSYKRAHEFELLWSENSESVLIMEKDYIDETGKSYYGASSLFFFNLKTRSYKDVTTYAGPIHEVCWDPEGVNFIVISGFMPAHTVLYSKKARAVFKFGANHRNKIYWSPNGHYFALAGLENLKGDIDIWDYKKRQIVASCTSNHASYFEWAPCSALFLTAIVERTLKVGNEFRGKLSVKQDYSNSKLYQANWLYDGNEDFFEHDEVEEEKVEVKPKKKLMFKWDDDDGFVRNTEKARLVSEKEIKVFNKEYMKELERQKAYEEKKRKDQEAKKKVKSKGPIVLQRGRFKIGQKKPEEKKEDLKANEKNKNRKNSRKISPPNSDKNSNFGSVKGDDKQKKKRKRRKRSRKYSKKISNVENDSKRENEYQTKKERITPTESPIDVEASKKLELSNPSKAESQHSSKSIQKEKETPIVDQQPEERVPEKKHIQEKPHEKEQQPDLEEPQKKQKTISPKPTQMPHEPEEEYHPLPPKPKKPKKRKRRPHQQMETAPGHYYPPQAHQGGHMQHQDPYYNHPHPQDHYYHQEENQQFYQHPQGQGGHHYEGYQHINQNMHHYHHPNQQHHHSMYQAFNNAGYHNYHQGHPQNYGAQGYYRTSEYHHQDHHGMYDNGHRGGM